MFDLFHLTLEVEPVHDDFFLYCVSPSGQILLPDTWKDALFLWHEQTYYGSEATQVEINGKKEFFFLHGKCSLSYNHLFNSMC